ncbi:hypothetical protein DKJ30_16170, partial [Salmonella enterica]|nr:hypothetical protein [Salmonella enterica]
TENYYLFLWDIYFKSRTTLQFNKQKTNIKQLNRGWMLSSQNLVNDSMILFLTIDCFLLSFKKIYSQQIML